MKISVIMPVFNSEKYLCEAVNSVLAQTFTDFELICVDDGSTDSSLDLLHKYASVDSRVKVLTQLNQFAGVARNYGMSIAKGEYLIFLDSDDFFKPEMLEFALAEIERERADICVFGADSISAQTLEVTSMPWYCNTKQVNGDKVVSRKSHPEKIFTITSPGPWNKLFRAAFIKEMGHEFQEIRSANDLAFVLTAIASANSIVILETSLLNYRTDNLDSLQGKAKREPFLFLAALFQLKFNLISLGIYDEMRIALANLVVGVARYNYTTIGSAEVMSGFVLMMRDIVFIAFDLDILTKENMSGEYLCQWLDKMMCMPVEQIIESEGLLKKKEVTPPSKGPTDLSHRKHCKLRGLRTCYREHGLKYTLREVKRSIFKK